MGLYSELIREKEKQSKKCETIADQLLLQDRPLHMDEMAGVQAALEIILDAFSVECKVAMGCSNIHELIDSTLDGAGLMCEDVDLSDHSFRKRTDWILAWLENGQPVVLRPGLLGYCCVDVQTKKRTVLKRNAPLKKDAYIIHRPVSVGKGSVRGIAQLIIRLITARDIFAVLMCTGLISLLGLVLPELNSWALNILLPKGGQAYGALIYGSAIFVTVGTFRTVLRALKSNLLSSMRIRIADQVQAALMARVLLKPYASFADSSAGRVSARIRAGQQLATRIINVFLDTSFTLLFSLVYIPQMLRFGAVLCVPALLMLLAKVAVSVFSFVSCVRNSAELLENEMENNSFLYTAICGIQKIKSVNAENRIYAKWALYYKKNLQLKLDPPMVMKLRSVLISFIGSLCTAVLLAVTAENGVPRGDYVAFNASYALCAAAVTQLLDMMESIFLMGPLVHQVDSLLEGTEADFSDCHYVRTLRGRITLENVCFSYPNFAKSSLTDINLDIHPREKVAIVGESGSGKSTLLKLMLGLEQCDSGSISYDGHSLNSLNVRSLRKRIGSVMQFSQVIPGTLYENIAFASSVPVSMEQAWEAAEKAAIADDIRSLKLQMDTEISETAGGGFSGGQRQRILLARALVGNPAVLLLDEASSALDNITQKRVLEAIYREKATVVMVAHRLSTIVDCDRIIMLEKGRIVESGSYQELMALNGKFADLVRRQQE
ncbi:MAG: ATP-binding cassette domain-containing protein [Bacillota bacterium]|nr:ATP-binding cassette domain-containing protein [Bacillota bacterium]